MTREADRRVLAKRGGFTFSRAVAVAVPVGSHWKRIWERQKRSWWLCGQRMSGHCAEVDELPARLAEEWESGGLRLLNNGFTAPSITH